MSVPDEGYSRNKLIVRTKLYISKFLLQSASHAVVNDSGKKIETIVCYIIFIDTNIALKSVHERLNFSQVPGMFQLFTSAYLLLNLIVSQVICFFKNY